jgi:hypothetical protein
MQVIFLSYSIKLYYTSDIIQVILYKIPYIIKGIKGITRTASAYIKKVRIEKGIKAMGRTVKNIVIFLQHFFISSKNSVNS